MKINIKILSIFALGALMVCGQSCTNDNNPADETDETDEISGSVKPQELPVKVKGFNFPEKEAVILGWLNKRDCFHLFYTIDKSRSTMKCMTKRCPGIF